MTRGGEVNTEQVQAVIRVKGVESIRRAPPWLIQVAIDLSKGSTKMSEGMVSAYPPVGRWRREKISAEEKRRRRG